MVMSTALIVTLVVLAVLIFGFYFIVPILTEEEPDPEVDPSIPGVHYYGECDYKGRHRHTDEAPTKIDASFKSVRVSDDFAVKAYSTTDQEVFIKGPNTVKCTAFKGMEVIPN